MFRVENPFKKYIQSKGYHLSDKSKNFVIIRYYLLGYTEVRVKIDKKKTLHISAQGLQNFPFTIEKSFVFFVVPTYIEEYRTTNYAMFEYLLDEFLQRIWFN